MTGFSIPAEVHAKHSGGRRRRKKTISALVRSLRAPAFLGRTSNGHRFKWTRWSSSSKCYVLTGREEEGEIPRVLLQWTDAVFQRLQSVECRMSQSPALHPCASSHVFFSDGAPCVSAASSVRRHCPLSSSKVQPLPLFFTLPIPRAATPTRSSIPSCEQDLMTQSNKCGVPPISLLSSF